MKPDSEQSARAASDLIPDTGPPRVILADNHALVLDGLRKLLEPQFNVVAAVSDGRTLLAEAQRLAPDFILLDISLSLLNGLEAARKLKELLPDSKIVFVTMHTDRHFVTEAFRVGASGYLLKHSGAAELLFALSEILKGHQYVTPLVTKDVLREIIGERSEHPARMPSKALTLRQREILRHVAEGRTLKEIARALNLSVKTVEYHKSRLIERLGFRSTAELTKYAIMEGIISL
jgi:DNA-binding NarL/FixJ family response regulator